MTDREPGHPARPTMSARRLPRLRTWAAALKRQALVVYFAARDPRTPWPVRLLALAIAAYAFSPVDLIPDVIPVLGYLDDLLIVPLGVLLVLRLLPGDVRRSARTRAAEAVQRPLSRAMAVAIVAVWVLVAAAAGGWLWRVLAQG